MKEIFKRRNKAEKPRQEWNPHWTLKLLYSIWMTAFSVFKIALGAAITVLLICVVCGAVFVGILGDYLQNDILPESANYELNISDQEQTSNAYYVDANGKIEKLQEIHTTIDREWVRFEDIPKNLINAAVAIEDKRFYEHQGVDWITTVKACINMFMGGDSQFGGSTITQQLIKNDTGEKSVTVQRKVMEIFRAQHAEKVYDKDTIMEWYLNSIYFGRGSYGVKSAAEEYFGKELESLTIAECASLISITNNPSMFNPFSESVYEYEEEMMDGRGRNRSRQLKVLGEMKVQGLITEEEYNEAKAQELEFKSGLAPEDVWESCNSINCDYEGTVGTYIKEGESYFCPKCGTQLVVGEDASKEVYSYFMDTVIEDVARDLAVQNGVDWENADKTTRDEYLLRIQRGGFHIYTTLDMDVQNQVDKIYTNLEEIPKTRSTAQLQSAMVIIDNTTGDIVAMAGGVGEKDVHDGLNRATDSKLQTGSSQKPLTVYAPAFEIGAASPVTVVKDMPISYTGGNFPKNDNRKYDYARTIFRGVQSSVNAIAVHTLDMIGFDYAFEFGKDKFGLSTLTEEYVLPSGTVLSDKGYSPLAMGALTFGATVRDMSAAYATFMNGGIYREARTYTKVYDSEGNLVLDNTQDSREILSQKTVNYMNYCLYHAANGGTGGNAVFPGQYIAGKTGTTSSNKDRWFCGFTGHYTAAVWCGYDTPEQIRLYDYSNPAAVLWRKVMQPIHEGLPKVSVYNGDNFRTVSMCLDSGMRATEACTNDVRGITRTSASVCYPEDIPGGACNKHVSVDYCVTGGGVATDWCSKFEDVTISKRSLVRMTQAEVDAIKAAGRVGLNAQYLDDSYVYLVTGGGNPGDWHGFSGKANDGVDAPYVVCTKHTREAWEKLEEEKRKEEEEKKKEEEEKRKEEEEKKQQEEAQKATEPKVPQTTTPAKP